MGNYLDLAEKVLIDQRRPLSAKAILRLAYLRDLVPAHLFGKTQHKTLQARLSEDIIAFRGKSRFFRTGPGKFFLRRFLTDVTIPEEYRREAFAKRRSRSLFNRPILKIFPNSLNNVVGVRRRLNALDLIESIKSSDDYIFDLKQSDRSGAIPLWVVTTINRRDQILSYKAGAYRGDHSSFVKKRSITFNSVVTESDQTLFDLSMLGVVESGISAVSSDLNVPLFSCDSKDEGFSHQLGDAFVFGSGENAEVVVHLEIKVPDWFEPVRGSLSINDLRWISASVAPNNIDDFDPWSRFILYSYISRNL